MHLGVSAMNVFECSLASWAGPVLLINLPQGSCWCIHIYIYIHMCICLHLGLSGATFWHRCVYLCTLASAVLPLVLNGCSAGVCKEKWFPAWDLQSCVHFVFSAGLRCFALWGPTPSCIYFSCSTASNSFWCLLFGSSRALLIWLRKDMCVCVCADLCECFLVWRRSVSFCVA